MCDQPSFEVLKNDEAIVTQKIDVVNILEKSILEILLLYGDLEADFENLYIKFDENQKEIEVIEKVKSKIFMRIYLNLQEDEIEFSNPIFKAIYDDLMNNYLQNNHFDNKNYTQNLDKDFAQIVTDIFMDDEKYQLHGWLEKKQVFVKEKTENEILVRLVTDNIIAYREYLINKLNIELMETLKIDTTNSSEILSSINDYNRLKVTITRSIGRIRSTYY